MLAVKAMSPQHFGDNPADIRLQIMNLDVNPGSLLAEILTLAEVCTL